MFTGEHESAIHAMTAMLEARSVALVGASARPGSLGARMVAEVSASPCRPRVYLVNPRYDEIGGVRCHARLSDLCEAVDLVLLGVPDAALEEQLTAAAGRGDRSAVIFGSAYDVPGQPPGLRDRLAAIARTAGMALCGAGCMGFVNVARGLRAVGYVEPDPLPAGPVALVTHSGSVFSALLRNRRAIGFSVAVSSGQELVTTAAAYARYALSLPETGVLALVLEAIRDAGLLRAVLAGAAAADVPVVLLAAGGSDRGRALVSAHSGALAAGDGAWEALAGAYGVHRVGDLAELADTLELFAIGRRGAGHDGPGVGPGRGAGAAVGPDVGAGAGSGAASGPGATPGPGAASGHGAAPGRGAGPGAASGRGAAPGRGAGAGYGIATVHDSGLERAHVADLAEQLGVPFAVIGSGTRGRLAALLDPGLEAANPLDMWGTGRDAEQQLTAALTVMSEDPAVGVVALAVDLVPEFDGDQSYQQAVLAAAARTSKPVVVLAGLPASIDPAVAGRLRAAGIPVLEGTRTGLLALRHLLDHARRPVPPPAPGADVVPGSDRPASSPAPGADGPPGPRASEPGRRRRWARALAAGPLSAEAAEDLLRDYGIPAVPSRSAPNLEAVLAAAAEVGYPVVLKTDEPGIAHKSDVGGVLTGLAGPAAVAAAYRDLATRLGPRVLVCQTAAAGTELILGIVRDPALGPLVVVGAGGVLTELLADRAVALPPVDGCGALRMLRRLRVSALLAGVRGQPPADLAAIAGAITGLSAIACELGDALDALDINPLICGPSGVLAVDTLAVPHDATLSTIAPELSEPTA
jgi:acyl-CoA synthetase (NDP forming)